MLLKWIPDKSSTQSGPSEKKQVLSANYLADVLDKLGGEDDAKEFETLKNQFDEQRRIDFILSRVGWSRAKAAHFTPRILKALKPPDTVLTWQSASFSFQGYYPIPKALIAKAEQELKEKQEKRKGKGRGKTSKVQTHWARSRNYKEKRTKLEALTWIVEWLWKTHKTHGGDPWGKISTNIVSYVSLS